MAIKVNEAQVRKLLKSSSSREFLAHFLEIKKEKSSQKLSYSNLARLSGFESRNYPRELVIGRRKISIQNAEKLAQGLRLSNDWTKYFFCLVKNENLPLQEKSTKSLKVIEKRILRKLYQNKKNGDEVYFFKDISLVYAALGGSSGSCFDEILLKTKLTEKNLNNILEKLETLELVDHYNDRWFPKVSHMAFSGLKQNGYFQKLYEQRLKMISEGSKKNFERQDALFWEMTYSVDEKALPALKERLREVLSQFCEGSDSETGQKIVSLCCGFMPLN